jgi:hypothetical protein
VFGQHDPSYDNGAPIDAGGHSSNMEVEMATLAMVSEDDFGLDQSSLNINQYINYWSGHIITIDIAREDDDTIFMQEVMQQ